MEKLDDNYYVKKIQEGETDSFTFILERYSRQVFSLIVKIVDNREDAEELTQDVFMKVFRSINSFRGDSSFSTWLYRIAYNTCISETRKKVNEFTAIDKTMLENVSDNCEDDLFDANGKTDRIQLLNKALELILPEERAMIMLFYKNDKSMDEIAIITGLSVTNVKTKIFRIRKKLFALIKSMEEVER
jgi:RNA polymerase sigma-70 factor (ECF subfamily)